MFSGNKTECRCGVSCVGELFIRDGSELEMGNFKVRVNSEAESREAQELFFQLGYSKGACSEGNYPADIIAVPRGFLSETPFSSRSIKLDHKEHEGYKEITLPELRAMVRPMKEYLDKQEDGTYKLISASGGCADRDWIEVPEGAEIAIKFKYDPDDFGVIFYKNNGKSCLSQNDKSWQNDADWTMKDLLDENYCEDGIDLSHDVLWQRATHPEELPFIDDEPTKQDLIDLSNKSLDAVLNTDLSQPMELEQVRQHRHYFIDVSDVDEVDFYEIALRYNVTDPCIQHILKKCLAVGQRGQKDFHHDLKDIYDTAKRMLDVHGLDS